MTHAKAQRRKEEVGSAALLCVFAALRWRLFNRASGVVQLKRENKTFLYPLS
jgi:hypothetical protein